MVRVLFLAAVVSFPSLCANASAGRKVFSRFSTHIKTFWPAYTAGTAGFGGIYYKLDKGMAVEPRGNERYRGFRKNPGMELFEQEIGLSFLSKNELEQKLIVVSEASGRFVYNDSLNVVDMPPDEMGIFVMDKAGNIFLHIPTARADMVRHSSLADGRDVAAAGQIRIVKGEIEEVNNFSLDYPPSEFSDRQVLDELAKKTGLDFTGWSSESYGMLVRHRRPGPLKSVQ